MCHSDESETMFDLAFFYVFTLTVFSVLITILSVCLLWMHEEQRNRELEQDTPTEIGEPVGLSDLPPMDLSLCTADPDSVPYFGPKKMIETMKKATEKKIEKAVLMPGDMKLQYSSFSPSMAEPVPAIWGNISDHWGIPMSINPKPVPEPEPLPLREQKAYRTLSTLWAAYFSDRVFPHRQHRGWFFDWSGENALARNILDVFNTGMILSIDAGKTKEPTERFFPAIDGCPVWETVKKMCIENSGSAELWFHEFSGWMIVPQQDRYQALIDSGDLVRETDNA